MNADDNGPIRLGKQFDPAQFVGMVEFKLKRGAGRKEIVQHLVSKGLDAHRAESLIDRVQQRLWAEEESRRITFFNLLMSALGGLVGAAVAVVAWALAVEFMGRELPWLAAGVGLLAAVGALMFSGKGGLRIQLIGLLFSILGAAVGEYLTRADLIGCRVFVLDLEVIKSDLNCALINLPGVALTDLPWALIGIAAGLWLLRRRKTMKLD